MIDSQNFGASTARGLLKALRHKPEQFGLRMDRDGWVDTLEVGKAINQMFQSKSQWDRSSIQRLTIELGLSDRIQFQGDACRASYGHSTIRFQPSSLATPDSCLFHGTSDLIFPSIEYFGILPMKRQFVQLTTDFDYAREVASKLPGNPVVLQISTYSAEQLKVRFYSTGTHVWLATTIPTSCLQVWMDNAVSISNNFSWNDWYGA